MITHNLMLSCKLLVAYINVIAKMLFEHNTYMTVIYTYQYYLSRYNVS